MSSGSARGLSLTAYVLETVAYAITLAYNYRNDFPFSTYGENFFLTIQNAIITLLIIYYPQTRLTRAQPPIGRVVLTAIAMAVASVALVGVPETTLSFLQLATLPISLFSKLPQIMQNHRAQSTGQLSAFAVFAQIAGCLARLFTTATEVGDSLITAGFALALVLNLILGAQIFLYWGETEKEETRVPVGLPVNEKEKAPWQQDNRQVEVVVPPQSPSPKPSGRKWARKVD